MRSQRAAVQENYEAVALDCAFARQSLAATTAKRVGTPYGKRGS